MLLTDDRGEAVRLQRLPNRIVSLVPSDTYTLLRLGAASRVVGRTEYCVEPADRVQGIATVGGTKNPDIERILELRPDLVVMNREENTRRDWEKFVGHGIAVLTTCPIRMAEGAAQVGRLARLVGDLDAAAKELVREAYRMTTSFEKAPSETIRAFVPIWMDPLMTINDGTFISDVLRCAGATNVFADRERRFPLTADLGRGPEFAPEKTQGRDTRYPRVTLDEVRARDPELIVLPDEPHPFSEADAEVFRSANIPSLAPENVRFCVGKSLMWPGLMSIEHHEHIRGLVQAAARVASTRRAR
ncbi:MAG: ABC transporter substrate-binding protein [Polyangiaceae bacterium]|nr:ABC transporter substrate-binding protein [Polyangiaceae bacterium]